jgi:adenylyltransferase/sulfurtransferase
MLNPEQFHRYSRQILLPEFGMEGQIKLSNAKVLVIGSGGLGSPVLLYLAAAGVGRIGIVDFDVVDESNLQRQVLFTTNDIGKPKAATAAEKIKALNPNIKVQIFNGFISSSNALEFISEFDLVIDGSDNLPTRYLVNDACLLLNKTLIYGAIFQFEGQVSVFNLLHADGTRGPNYRDLFPQPPPPEMVPSCSEGGVLGVLPGIIGSMMANEAIKVITGIGSTLSGRLLLFDALDFTTRFLKIQPNLKAEKITQLIDYEEFCNPRHARETVQEIDAFAAKQLLADNNIQVVDVREKFEVDAGNVGGIFIPLNELEYRLHEIPKEKTLLTVCKSGSRSRKAATKLKSLGYNVINLTGGLSKWKSDLDPELIVV